MEPWPVPGWVQSDPEWNSGAGMVIGALVWPKSGIDLMQNCDLPPPMKVFAGLEKAVSVITPINRNGSEGIEKLELLKALRLSQTRAREAERKAASLAEERDRISNALLKESLRLFAYKQWVRLLEIQVLSLQNQERQFCCSDKREGKEEEDQKGMPWLVALAICLGLGVAFWL